MPSGGMVYVIGVLIFIAGSVLSYWLIPKYKRDEIEAADNPRLLKNCLVGYGVGVSVIVGWMVVVVSSIPTAKLETKAAQQLITNVAKAEQLHHELHDRYTDRLGELARLQPQLTGEQEGAEIEIELEDDRREFTATVKVGNSRKWQAEAEGGGPIFVKETDSR